MDALAALSGQLASTYTPGLGGNFRSGADPVPVQPARVEAASAGGRSSAGTRNAGEDILALHAQAYGALRARQDGLNAQAQALRAGEIEPYVMRKLFPPYPPEQEARMALLDAVGGMRRQIEQLLPYELSGPANQDAEAAALALSAQSGQQLARQFSAQPVSASQSVTPPSQPYQTTGEGISRNRFVLEAVVQETVGHRTVSPIDPVQ